MEDCDPVQSNGSAAIIFYDGLQDSNGTLFGESDAYDYINGTVLGEENESISYESVENVLYKYVVTAICVCGILGNFLNLVVLTRKSLQKNMDRMEKSAHVGLIAMAISDKLFCVSVLPHAWVPAKQFMYEKVGFNLVYSLYGSGVINTFIMSSTWLTVTISASRYFAIVHPLRAREVIGMTFAKCSMILTFLLCILFNLPRFWAYTPASMACTNGRSVYFRDEGYFLTNHTFQTAYMWIYFFVGIVIPVIILTYCNIYLIRALKRSVRMREQYQPAASAVKESANRVTLTLVVIIVMYILFVAPLEVLNFFKDMVISQSHMGPSFNVAIAILNTFQAINFSFNFVLYCVVNTHFRLVVADLFCTWGKKGGKKENTTGWYESVSATTTV